MVLGSFVISFFYLSCPITLNEEAFSIVHSHLLCYRLVGHMCIGLSLGLLLKIFSSISWSYVHFVDGFLCWAETFKSDVVLLWWFCFCRLCFFLTFFYFWLCWVFFVVWGLLVAVLLRSTGSRHMGIRCGTQASVVVAHWLSSCSSRALGCELSGLWHMGSVAP